MATVEAYGGQEIMTSVTWTVTGAMQSQTYQNSIGNTTPLSGSVTHTWNGGAVSTDTFSPYWNATPGVHTISASVTYQDGSQYNLSTQVNVAQPTVNSFGVIYGPTTFDISKGWFYSYMSYSGSVTVPPNAGGQIGVIQMITANNTETVQTNTGGQVGQATYVMNTPGVVLDNYWGMTRATDPGYLIANSAAQVTNGTATLANATDVPKLSNYWGPNGVLTTDIRLDYTFQDYLVYQPSGGIWVQLAQTPSYSEYGEEKWVGPLPGGTWQVVQAPSPSQATPLSGSASLGFVQWDDYFNNNYNSWRSQ